MKSTGGQIEKERFKKVRDRERGEGWWGEITRKRERNGNRRTRPAHSSSPQLVLLLANIFTVITRKDQSTQWQIATVVKVSPCGTPENCRQAHSPLSRYRRYQPPSSENLPSRVFMPNVARRIIDNPWRDVDVLSQPLLITRCQRRADNPWVLIVLLRYHFSTADG